MTEEDRKAINDSKCTMETAHGKPRDFLQCWLKERNAHGLVYTPHFFPVGEGPEVGEWIRAPWLDER